MKASFSRALPALGALTGIELTEELYGVLKRGGGTFDAPRTHDEGFTWQASSLIALDPIRIGVLAPSAPKGTVRQWAPCQGRRRIPVHWLQLRRLRLHCCKRGGIPVSTTSYRTFPRRWGQDPKSSGENVLPASRKGLRPRRPCVNGGPDAGHRFV